MDLTFNREIESMQASTSVVLMEKAKAMQARGEHVINLAGGEPNFDTPPAAVCSAIRAMTSGQTHYVAGAGLPALRERIARQLREEQGIDCQAEHIFVTPGGKFAIYLLARVLLNAGDEALIPQPSWVSYSSIVQAAGGTAVPVPLDFADGYQLRAAQLEQYVTPRTRLLILNSPNNPTGRVLTRQEMEAADAFAKKHGLLILADEIYGSLCYPGTEPVSFGALPDGLDHVAVVNGFSKSAAMTGWRVGYICTNREILRRVAKLYQHTMTCIPAFSQAAALAACGCKAELEEMLKQYTARRAAFIGQLQQIRGVDIRMPEGAFYAWMRVRRGNLSDTGLCEYLLQNAGVAGVSGSAFGETNGAFVRFSFASSMEDLNEAAVRIKAALEQLPLDME